jgi:Flp pilus assembly protein CpaB
MGLTTMNLQRMLCASSLAAGMGLAGLLGTAIATANAAPAPASNSQQTTSPVKLASSKIKPTHHQKKEIGKEASKQAKHDGLTAK